jgi:mono/diheme cytochrome c family protein
VNLYRHQPHLRRHSDTEQREVEESPHLFPQRGSFPPARPVGIACVIFATAFFLVTFSSANLTPPARAFSHQSRAAGAAVFHDKGCEHCHGVDGTGTDRGPELSTIGKRWHKDRIAQQILRGGGGMPPFGAALQPDEVKQLVDYLSAKRKAPKSAKPPAAAKPPSNDDSGL